MHRLSAESLAAVRTAVLDDDTVLPFSDGEVTLLVDRLPGRAVVGVRRDGGHLWMIVDDTKPSAGRHLLELLDTWPTAVLAEVWPGLETLEIPFPLPRSSAPSVIRQLVRESSEVDVLG